MKMIIDSSNIFGRAYNPADVQHNRQNYAEYISFWLRIGRNDDYVEGLIRADRNDRAYDC